MSEKKKVENTFMKCGQMVLISVLAWTVGRDGFKEKMEKQYPVSNTWYKKNFGSPEQKFLEESFDVEKFDITLLYNLIRFLSGIEDSESEEWTKGSKFAYSIYKVKQLRNRFSHQRLTEDEENRDIKVWYQILKKLFTEILTEVGKFKSIDQDRVNKNIEESNKELSCLLEVKQAKGSDQEYNTNTRPRKLNITVRDDVELNEFLQNLKSPDYDCSNYNVMLRFKVKPSIISDLEETVHLLTKHKGAEVGLWLEYEYFNEISEVDCSDSLIQKLSSEASLCYLISFKGRVKNIKLLSSHLKQLIITVTQDEIQAQDLNQVLCKQKLLWNLVIKVECNPGEVLTPPTLHYNRSRPNNQLGIRLESELNDTDVQWAVNFLVKLCPPTRDRDIRYWATSLCFWKTHLT
ncbi:unnamed protein product, partial [Meganyctiphanes norvegica]